MQFKVITLIITRFYYYHNDSTHFKEGWRSEPLSFAVFALEKTEASVAVQFAAMRMRLDIFPASGNAPHSCASPSADVVVGVLKIAVAQNPLEAV